MAATSISTSGLLLCEGKDEVSFFNAWFTELGMTDVTVLDYGGKARVTKFLADVVKMTGFSKVRFVGITRDADENAVGAMDSLESAVANAPEELRVLRPALFVLPGEGQPGALESLWLASLRGDPIEGCVDGFFRCAESYGWVPSDIHAKNDKARAQIWIATKDTPNERFGIAAWHGRKDTDKPWMQEKWVNFDHPSFVPLKNFLLSTFTSAS